MQTHFKPMTLADIPLWENWIQKPHVKNTWFIAGYEPPEYIHKKITAQSYDYPFIFYLDEKPIGYIVCCDLYAYRTQCPNPKGVFTQEEPGTFRLISAKNVMHYTRGCFSSRYNLFDLAEKSDKHQPQGSAV